MNSLRIIGQSIHKIRGMNKFFTLRRALLLLTLTLPSFCWGLPPQNALIVIDPGGGGVDEVAVTTFLTGRLANAGYTVSTNAGVPGGSLSTNKQIWDIRYSTALIGPDITSYLTYLSGGGALFVMGENSGFLTRDNSILALITAAGGGSPTLTAGNSLNLQTVNPPFTGPVTLATITYAAAGGFATAGQGAFVTQDANGKGGAIIFAPGTLGEASNGTLASVLDVNFLDPNFPPGVNQALADNLIAYLAAPSPVGLPPVPAPTSILLVLIGLGATGLYTVYRRKAASIS
jgi:hypothetical protein